VRSRGYKKMTFAYKNLSGLVNRTKTWERNLGKWKEKGAKELMLIGITFFELPVYYFPPSIYLVLLSTHVCQLLELTHKHLSL